MNLISSPLRLSLCIQNFKTIGGLQKYAHRIAKGFTKKGAHVDIITSDLIDNTKAYPSIHFHSCPLKKRLNFRKMQEFDLFCQKWHQNHSNDMIFGMDRTRYQTHIRAGNGVHAAYIKTRENYSLFKAALNPLNKTILQIEKEAFESPHLKVLFTNSHMVKKQILEYYNTDPNTIEVIHNGVEWQEMQKDFNSWITQKEYVCNQLGLNPTSFQFLFIGNGYERKGLLHLLKALTCFPFKNFHLSIIGKDKNLNDFIKKTKQLGLSNHVSYFGPRSDIRRFYQIADTLVIPSLYDPFANVTVEALAMGLFVVSSNSNGGHEILKNGIGTVIPNIKDPDSFAQALSIALACPKTWSSSQRIRNSVKYLDFSNQITRVIDTSIDRL